MVIIGVSGGSGSGKTSFIRDIRAKFNCDQVTLLSQDEYYNPKEDQLIDEQGVVNFDLPSSINLDEFVADIKALKRGEVVKRTEYTFNNKLKEPKELIYQPNKVLIVEGLFVFHDPRIRELLDLKVMIYASSALKVIRRIKRDRIERNYPLEDVLYRYEHHVLPAFKKYIEPYLDKVDIVVNNNQNYKQAICMFNAYIDSQIKE